MIILNNFDKKHNFDLCNLTIGVFDGLHLGHALILQKLKEKKGKSIVFTFENHPLEVLKPDIKIPLIYNKQDKLKYLKSFGIDVVILIKFNIYFANIYYKDFFKILQKNFSFSHLVIGDDAKIGKDGEGDLNKIQDLEQELHFKSEFIEKIKYKDRIISSRWIRALLKEKNYALAEKLLNRKLLKEKHV
ncbi:MAG: Riboflavin biosynthesis protein RibF [Candidatus Anoxychlamydiales bacterium]|nr:Riboflavin biosynthesis protein RibF [Candidatus Anoxychlamydiales bacterium]